MIYRVVTWKYILVPVFSPESEPEIASAVSGQRAHRNPEIGSIQGVAHVQGTPSPVHVHLRGSVISTLVRLVYRPMFEIGSTMRLASVSLSGT